MNQSAQRCNLSQAQPVVVRATVVAVRKQQSFYETCENTSFILEGMYVRTVNKVRWIGSRRLIGIIQFHTMRRSYWPVKQWIVRSMHPIIKEHTQLFQNGCYRLIMRQVTSLI